MKNWTTYFWDWNGTILNDIEGCISITNKSLKQRSLPLLTKEIYLEKFDFPVKKYYQNVGFDFKNESFEEAGQEFIQEYRQMMLNFELQEGAIELMEKLKNLNKKQFILSALNSKSLKISAKKYGVDKYFSIISGLDDNYANSKVELGLELLKKSGADPKKSVMIGDTTHDYETAKAMGIDCILIAAGHNSKKRLEECGVTVFNNLNEMSDCL